MKVLLDACVWSGASGPLRAAGHDVVWAGDWPDSPSDREIMERAASQRRVLVTLDKDFSEVIEAHASDLARGAIVTVEPSRVRVRPPDGTTN